MRTTIKLLLAVIVAALLTATADAYDFMVDGLCYNRNSDGTSVTVTYQNSSSPRYSSLNGALEIPASVSHNGTDYSVTSIGYWAFSDCSRLTSVTIPNSVTSIGESAFGYCRGLTSVTIPNSVTSIDKWAFYGCSGLTSLTIPNSVTSIGDMAFYGCSGLTSVTIGNSVTSIGDRAFEGTPWFNKQPDGLVYAGLVAYKYKGTMPDGTSIVIKDGTLGIAGSCFSDCSGLTSVTIPNSVTSIGNSAFYYCSGLTSVTIGNSVTSIGDYAFEYCRGLTSVTIPNSVTSIGDYAFKYCRGLTSVTIPNSVTSIGGYAFSGCSGLTSVTIPNSVTSIGHSVFSGCSGLTSVTIPNSVTSIGEYAFMDCSGLTSVTIPNSVTSIGTSAFVDCSGLTSVTIPNSVTEIGEYAFSRCTGLTSVIIPNSVTSIGNYAFRGCYGLTSVTIPNSVTSIGYKVFDGCSRIRNVFLYGDGEFQVNQGLGISSSNYTLFIKSGVTGIKGLGLSPGTIYSYRTAPPTCDANSFTAYTAALHVPESALVDYVTADYWSNFTNLTTDAVELESLSLSQTEAVLTAGGNVTLSTTATPANFTPSCNVSWSSTNPAVATVYNGNVTAVGFGECDIIATLYDKTATCHVTVQEQQVVITLDKHELTMQPNKIEWLTPSMSPVSTDLVVESSDTGVVIARLANGKVQVISVKLGTATVTVSSADGKAVPDQCVVHVVTSAGIWDVNGDGAVDVGDVNTVLADILATGGKTAAYDVNGDGKVDVGDVNAILAAILTH